MGKNKGRTSFRKKILFVVVGTVLFSSLFITVLESFGFVSWNHIYDSVGVKDFSTECAEYDLSVHFIDVGKADSIYIKCKDKNVLIDAGEKDTYNLVGEYLRKQRVETLNLVIATHPHSDHIGGMPEVLEEFDVERFLAPRLKDEIVPTSRTYEKLLLALKDKHITPEFPISGTEIVVGDMDFIILAPNAMYDNVNENSIVTKLIFKNQSFLFTGDAGNESENDMMKRNFDLSANVLKVGHHGSKSATSGEFLKRVNPMYAVICVNTDRYNLPNKKTVDRLKVYGTSTYRTDMDGTVILASNGERITVIKEKENNKRGAA